MTEKIELVCPIENCRNLPIVHFHKNSSKITLKCSSHQKNNKLYDIKEYLKICKSKNEKLLCSNCHKNIISNNYIFYCSYCKKLFDDKCITTSKCDNNVSHKKVETSYNLYYDKILCFKHKKNYSKYCKKCGISFCDKCFIKNHENHGITEIFAKTRKDLDDLSNKLIILEDSFKKVKKTLNDILEEIEDKLKLKRIIYDNYTKNTLNGNSFENIAHLNLSINNTYKAKIDSIFNNNNYQDKLFILSYYYLMSGNDNDEYKNKILNLEKELIKLKEKEIKNDFQNNYKNENINNILKKKFIEEDENNINNYNKNMKNLNEFNNKAINIIKNKINNDNVEKDKSNKNKILKDSANDNQKDNYKLEKGNSLNSIINTIIEDSIIYSLIRLSSGNLALGFSSGLIKIYNSNSICLPNNNAKNNDKNLLLIIKQFKGRRINYIQELRKDKTLLCCSYSKIHHIQLINNDRNYLYIGLIRISPNEIPKKIIELGNDLIVSLSEKNYFKVNIRKTKCILRVFRYVNSSMNIDENGIISDSGDSDAVNSSVDGEDWEPLFSNEEDEPLSNKDEILMEDKYIKIYKKNKNYDDVYICSIFGTKTITNKENDTKYEFIATSNKIFEDGQNYILIYSVLKKSTGRGFNIFIDKTIQDAPCSKMVNSICKINSEYVAIALQKYKDSENDGILILNINKKETKTIIKGFSIAMTFKEISSGYFFITNKTNDVNKCDEIWFVEKLNKKLDKNNLKRICNINSRFSGLMEIKPNHSKNLCFYAITCNKALFIISKKNELINKTN